MHEGANAASELGMRRVEKYTGMGGMAHVDAETMALLVWYIVPKMSTARRNHFSIWQAAHILPHDFGLPERGPAMCVRFLQELLA